jgi:hypothetical protein
MAFRSVSKEMADRLWSAAEKAIRAATISRASARLAAERLAAERLAAGRCPDCEEPLHFLTDAAAFCLKCDWDNLAELSRIRRVDRR